MSLVLAHVSVFMYLQTIIGGNRQLKYLLLIACKSYTMSDFQQTLCRLTHDTREVFVNIGHAKWARPYFPNICWNVMNIDSP
uniref:Uncharacterized protein n=1 Tax=Lactuca sativa TaxID=4236 RepID=A0A9R1WTX6_LACSA|nr:hypothetical protein LSAT_V11C900466050 [Lactuca sativa]